MARSFSNRPEAHRRFARSWKTAITSMARSMSCRLPIGRRMSSWPSPMSKIFPTSRGERSPAISRVGRAWTPRSCYAIMVSIPKKILRGSIAAVSHPTRNAFVWRCLTKVKSMQCAAIHRTGISRCRWAGIAEKPFVVKGMVRAILRGTAVARVSKEETLDSILRHNHYITRELATLAYDEVHKEWGPVLDFDAYQRKVDIYTSEWNLPKKPVSDYYNFKYLKEALEELGMLRSWDPKMDLKD